MLGVRELGRCAGIAAVSALLLVAPACGGDDDGSAMAGALTAQEVCDLLPEQRLADIVGVEEVTAEAGPSTAPEGCVYAYIPEGSTGTANLFLQEVPGGGTGSEGLAAALERAGVDDAEPLPGADIETARSQPGFGSLVFAVGAGDRVLSFLFDSGLDDDRQAAIVNLVASDGGPGGS